MALVTTAGTETLHSHWFSNVDLTTDQALIMGVQHHIYTVLSVIIHCNVLNATTDKCYLKFQGMDLHATGGSGTVGHLATINMQVGETYVWNDKFSFNGTQPSGADNVMSADVQIAVAAQASTTPQYLLFDVDHATDDFDVLVTYIDQNNA